MSFIDFILAKPTTDKVGKCFTCHGFTDRIDGYSSHSDYAYYKCEKCYVIEKCKSLQKDKRLQEKRDKEYIKALQAFKEEGNDGDI
jgi:hypothetical protein